MKLRTLLTALGVLAPLAAAQAAQAAPPTAEERAEVMKPIEAFFAALKRRDAAGMAAVAAPHIEVMSARKGDLRRLNIDTLGQLIANFHGGDVAEPIFDSVVHVDGDLAAVWTPYTFTVNGKVDHCGTDLITLIRIQGTWTIVGLADNAREDCR